MCRKLIYLVSSILLLSVPSSVCADLVGYWKLDEGSGTIAYDSSGNGNDGTLVDNPVWDITWISGRSGGAVEFYGVGTTGGNGDYFDCGSDPSLNMTGPISIALWIRPDADDPEGNLTTTAPLAKTDGSDWSFQVRYGWGQGAPEPYMSFTFNSSPRAWAHVGKNLERYEWCHIACSHDGETLKCYLNGEETDSVPMGQFAGVGTPVIIGTDGWGCDWIGAIDDVRLYDHALSEAEILGTMEGGMSPQAWGPTPKDGEILIQTWTNLSWKPGPFAVSHDVYIGENFDDVNAGAESVFQGNQAVNNLIVGFPTFPHPDGLVPGTTYYWRIDEVNDADPNSPWKGDVWSFAIAPKTAYAPDPADGAEQVDPDVELSWLAGFNGKLHTIYFGENFDDVNNATEGVAQGITTYTPGSLKLAKTYYWRVDEFDGAATYKGDVWSFTTEGAVGNPNPANGAVDIERTPILTWTPGVYAASHQVYFGTDKEAVKNANTSSPEYKATGNLGSESYNPGKLQWYSTYYWRIDEANNVHPDSPWIGSLWSFTTADFIVIDDFEDYNDYPPDEIFSTWIDGWEVPTNGSMAGHADPPFAETGIVHGGDQSMPLYYDNNFMYSEATMTLTQRDWTEEGVGVLSLWFRGNSDNAAERMYVALNGSAVVYHGNPDAALIAAWTEWTIDLQEFAAQGVNLANVNTISIGFGDKNNLQAGGSGMVLFDDIRLYRPAP
jgi:hypothetical protein